MVSFIPGRYETTVDPSAGLFWVKCGMDEESVKGFIGLKTIQELKSLGENTVYWNNEIPDVPEMKTGVVIKEGLGFELTFRGIGTVKYDIKSIGDNQIEMTEVHEKFGAVDCKATFCDKGSEWVYHSKEHDCKYTQNFTRVIDMDGTFRLVGKIEGGEDFPLLLEGFTMKVLEDPSYKYHIEVTDEGFCSTDYIEGKPWVSKSRFGVEAPSAYDENITELHIKAGPGLTKSVTKHKDGRVQETTVAYSPCGNQTNIKMKDLRSGKTCSMNFERFCDFSGTFKVISMTGLEEFCKVIGGNAEEAKMFYNHPETLFSWKETGNFCESVLSHKGSNVLNLGFNYNEEFTTKYPHMGDTPWNVIVTKQGNILTTVSKSDTCTMKSVMERTKNFLIMCDEVIGTGVKTTMICMPC